MKIDKIYFGTLLLVFISLLSVNVVGIGTKGYLHSNDYYSVMYDAEGDAIVTAKLVLYNTKNENLDEIKLEFPSSHVVIYNLVQEVYEKENYPYYYGNLYYPIEYEKEILSSATLLTLHLQKAIKPQKEGVILIFYKIPQATVVDSLGVHEFDFKTIIDKNAALIQMVRVSVDVQTGLYLKGGSRGEVEYKPGYYSSKIQSIEIAKEGTRSKELTDFSRRITYHTGGLVKIAYNLDPYESFHVKGKFADSFLKLYILEILLSIAIVGIIIILFKKILLKKFRVVDIITGEKGSKIFSLKANKKLSVRVIRSCIFGFLSAIFITVIWFLILFIFNFLGRTLTYSQSSMIMPLVLLFGIILMAVSIFGPVLLVGVKYGALDGILTLIFIGLWLLTFILIIIIFGILFFSNPRPTPIKLLEKSFPLIVK